MLLFLLLIPFSAISNPIDTTSNIFITSKHNNFNDIPVDIIKNKLPTNTNPKSCLKEYKTKYINIYSKMYVVEEDCIIVQSLIGSIYNGNTSYPKADMTLNGTSISKGEYNSFTGLILFKGDTIKVTGVAKYRIVMTYAH